MRYLLLLFISISLFSKDITTLKNYHKYDLLFSKEYNKYFYPYKHIYNYKIIKAQSIQESLLNPQAKSSVGASGLMQLMPLTFKSLKKRLHKKGYITNPKLNIELGVYYDKRMFNIWKAKRTLKSRYSLMFSSYNAGAGNLIKAQKKCKQYKKSCSEYETINYYLYYITGHYSKETNTYVKRIWKYFYYML